MSITHRVVKDQFGNLNWETTTVSTSIEEEDDSPVARPDYGMRPSLVDHNVSRIEVEVRAFVDRNLFYRKYHPFRMTTETEVFTGPTKHTP